VKGAGVDCAMLLVRVFCDLEILPRVDPRPYKPQWFLHQEEPLFLGWLKQYARQVEVAQPGDVALLKFGKQAAHGAIVLSDYAMVHAYKPAGRVIRDTRRALQHRVDSYWTVFP
jgi:cell wall-associated NlpC family hydrolase